MLGVVAAVLVIVVELYLEPVTQHQQVIERVMYAQCVASVIHIFLPYVGTLHHTMHPLLVLVATVHSQEKIR